MTNDSAPKKVIAIDFDDVVMNWHGEFMAYSNQAYGSNLTYEQLTTYDDWEVLYGCDVATITERVKLFYQSPEHFAIKPIPGAVEAISRLSPTYSLQIVTSRPENVRPRVEEWLNRYLPEQFENLHFTNIFAGEAGVIPRKKSEVCRDIGAMALIDDAIKHVTDAAENGITALLPDRPWNRKDNPNGVIRLYSWNEIADWIEKNV